MLPRYASRGVDTTKTLPRCASRDVDTTKTLPRCCQDALAGASINSSPVPKIPKLCKLLLLPTTLLIKNGNRRIKLQ